MSPFERLYLHRRRRAVSGGTARLRPPAETPATEPQNHAGILRPDTSTLKLPEGYAASVSGETPYTGRRPSGVLMVVVAIAIAFILIVAYFVSRMPEG